MTTMVKLQKFWVWGSGPAQSALIKNADPSLDAAEYAASKGYFRLDSPDDWAVEVETERDLLDAVTRYDSAVLGWTVAKN